MNVKFFVAGYVSFSLTEDEAFDVMSITPTSYPSAVVGLV